MSAFISQSQIPSLMRFLVRLLISTILVSTFFVVTQDFHIFPGLYSSLLFDYENTAPQDVLAMTTTASDGQSVNVWRMRADGKSQRSIALLFHGNAEHLANFVHVQFWLKAHNITSYAMEYRGYSGRNSGWPSEKGFYADGEAVFELLIKEEHVDPSAVIILGSSIGTGVATYIAQKYQAGTLVLLSPYTSLTDVVSEMPFFGFLSPFLKYRFPSSEYMERLTHTCVVDAHGKADSTIPFNHSEILKAHYHGNGSYTLILSEDSGHNNLMAHVSNDIVSAIDSCISNTYSQRKITQLH